VWLEGDICVVGAMSRGTIMDDRRLRAVYFVWSVSADRERADTVTVVKSSIVL